MASNSFANSPNSIAPKVCAFDFNECAFLRKLSLNIIGFERRAHGIQHVGRVFQESIDQLADEIIPGHLFKIFESFFVNHKHLVSMGL